MKFKEYDTVRVVTDCKNIVKKGDVGAIIMIFEKPYEAYEVEFLDSEGNFKAQCTFLPNEIELALN